MNNTFEQNYPMDKFIISFANDHICSPKKTNIFGKKLDGLTLGGSRCSHGFEQIFCFFHPKISNIFGVEMVVSGNCFSKKNHFSDTEKVKKTKRKNAMRARFKNRKVKKN